MERPPIENLIDNCRESDFILLCDIEDYILKIENENKRLKEMTDGIMGHHYCDYLQFYADENERLWKKLEELGNVERVECKD